MDVNAIRNEIAHYVSGKIAVWSVWYILPYKWGYVVDIQSAHRNGMCRDTICRKPAGIATDQIFSIPFTM